MGHREIYGVLHELLVSYFQKPFKMLDLGCGDASFTAQVLLDTNIVSYQGVDLSIGTALNQLDFTECTLANDLDGLEVLCLLLGSQES